jgi:hypothetical protein
VNPQHINTADYCVPTVEIGKQASNFLYQPYTLSLFETWPARREILSLRISPFLSIPTCKLFYKELGITCRTLTGLYTEDFRSLKEMRLRLNDVITSLL